MNAHADFDEVTYSEAERLGEEIALTAAHIDAATHRLLTQIRVFDRAGGWTAYGAVSCAHWLSFRIGLSPGAAREKVRVANALGALPAIDDALRQGQVSYSKVRALTRIATPDNEAVLLEWSRHMTAAQVEKMCRLWNQVRPRAASPELERERRQVRCRDTDDGMVVIEARLRPEEAATVLKALDVSAETRDRADGLVAVAERALGRDEAAGPPVEVVVQVDAATLEGEVESSAGVSATTARRLCCDAGVVPAAVDGNRNPLGVGRRKRTVPAALRRALRLRDDGCRFPGCTHRRWLDAHHIEHWIDGGPTELTNLTLLCRRHHRYVHEFGFTIRPSAGAGAGAGIEFVDPRGQVVPSSAPSPAPIDDGFGAIAAHNRARGLDVSAETNRSFWEANQPPDYDRIVQVLGEYELS